MRPSPLLSALGATLLLVACAQGAGPAPDIRPDDPETIARARTIIDSSIDQEAVFAGVRAGLRDERRRMVQGLVKYGLTQSQAEATVDQHLADWPSRTYASVREGVVSALVHTCSPLELELAVPGQGLGPCLELRGDVLRARIKAENAARRGPFIVQTLTAFRDEVVRQAPEPGLSPAQVAELSEDLESTLAKHGLN